MLTTIELAEALGRKNIADAVGVGLTAVSNAVVRGSFPSSWFLAISDLSVKAGQDCPPSLFNMRVAGSPDVEPSAHIQDPLSKSTGAA